MYPYLLFSRTCTTLFSCLSSVLKGTLDNMKSISLFLIRFASTEPLSCSYHSQIILIHIPKCFRAQYCRITSVRSYLQVSLRTSNTFTPLILLNTPQIDSWQESGGWVIARYRWWRTWFRWQWTWFGLEHFGVVQSSVSTGFCMMGGMNEPCIPSKILLEFPELILNDSWIMKRPCCPGVPFWRPLPVVVEHTIVSSLGSSSPGVWWHVSPVNLAACILCQLFRVQCALFMT